MAALWQQQRPWPTSCSAVRFTGPASVAAPIAVASGVAPLPTTAATTTTATATTPKGVAVVPVSTVQALERSNEVLSRQRWAAIGLVMLAAVILLVLMLWVWLKDRCTGDADCASLCPRADVPCASRCNRGRCEQVPVSCTQPGQAWCPSRRACIDTRTEVCATPGLLPITPAPVAPVTPPPPPITPPPVAPVTPAMPPVMSHGLVGQQQQMPPFPLPASPWDVTNGGPTGPAPGQPMPPVEPDEMTAVALVPIMMQCTWEAAAGPQTVVVNGVTYVVEPAVGAVRLADGDGRLWECGSGGRWWHMGPLDDGGSVAPVSDANDYYAAAAANTVVCWDQGMDVVWTNDAYGRTWAAPRKGAQGWAACDPASGASAVAPPPPVPIDANTAQQDIARGRASVAAAAAALTPKSMSSWQ